MNRRFYPDNAIKAILLFIIVVVGVWYERYSFIKLQTTPTPIRMGSTSIVDTSPLITLAKKFYYPNASSKMQENSVVFLSNDSPDKIADWYTTSFVDNDYTVTASKGTLTSEETKKGLTAVSGKQEIFITISKTKLSNETKIGLTTKSL